MDACSPAPQISGMDDPESPTIMDRILSSLGAEVIPWGFKTECCGAGLPLVLPRLVYHLGHRILKQAQEGSAEAIVVACPMCHSNLDLYQDEISHLYGEELRIPIIYISQAVGLALDLPPGKIGAGPPSHRHQAIACQERLRWHASVSLYATVAVTSPRV